jgi:hypothetical protein
LYGLAYLNRSGTVSFYFFAWGGRHNREAASEVAVLVMSVAGPDGPFSSWRQVAMGKEEAVALLAHNQQAR